MSDLRLRVQSTRLFCLPEARFVSLKCANIYACATRIVYFELFERKIGGKMPNLGGGYGAPAEYNNLATGIALKHPV
jgi:hypothetical protein